MKLVNTPDDESRQQDWGAGAQLFLSDGLQYWENTTGRDCLVRLSLDIGSGPAALSLVDTGQTIVFTPNISGGSGFSAIDDIYFARETFIQGDSWVKGPIQLQNKILVLDGEFLAYTVKSSDADDDTVLTKSDQTLLYDLGTSGVNMFVTDSEQSDVILSAVGKALKVDVVSVGDETPVAMTQDTADKLKSFMDKH